jgi:hypothetical protein
MNILLNIYIIIVSIVMILSTVNLFRSIKLNDIDSMNGNLFLLFMLFFILIIIIKLKYA